MIVITKRDLSVVFMRESRMPRYIVILDFFLEFQLWFRQMRRVLNCRIKCAFRFRFRSRWFLCVIG